MARALVVPVLLVTAAVLLVGLHVRAYTQVGPVDEMQHIGYLYEVPGVVVSGDVVSQDTLDEVACRGIDAAVTPPACGAEPYVPVQFPEAGLNTAYIHPPTYYALTRLGAMVVAGLSPADNLVTAGRLVGAAWLSAGLLLAYAAGRRLGAGRLQLVGPLLLAASTPAILMPAATVNPDSASFAVGALCLLLVVMWTQQTGRARWWLLVAAGLAAEVIKLQNLVVLLALGLFLLVPVLLPLEGTGTRKELLRDRALAVAVLGAPALLVALGWSAAVRLLAVVPPDDIPMSSQFLVDGLTFDNFAVHIGSFLAPLAGPYTPPPLAGALTGSLVVLTSGLVVAGLVASALFDVEGPSRSLGVATLVVGVVGAPFLVLMNFVAQGQFINIPNRYALTLVPLMVVLLALRLTPRWSAVVTTALGVLTVLAACTQLAIL